MSVGVMAEIGINRCALMRLQKSKTKNKFFLLTNRKLFAEKMSKNVCGLLLRGHGQQTEPYARN